jgi:hypothetical protein
MWAVMLFVFGGVVNSIPDLRTKCIVGGSGIALVAFSTSAMIAVYIHLKKNGNALYNEEVNGCADETQSSQSDRMLHKNERRTTKNAIVEVFDVVFIMVLCFGTLLTSMLLQGKVIIGSGETGNFDYNFSIPLFLLTLATFFAFLLYVLPRSNTELRSMIDRMYKK